MVTMKDVAGEAGVSVGTVSNVLNFHSSVTETTRMKVLDAVQKLQYRQNLVARSLKTKRSGSIGLILPDITNPYYPRMARGIEDAAREYDFTVFLCNTDRKQEKEETYINELLRKGVDGLIWVKPLMPMEFLQQVNEQSRLVIIENSESANELHFVNVDIYNGVQSAIRYLIEKGHTRIAFIGGLMNSKDGRDRYEAYKNTLKQADIGFPEEYIRFGNYGPESGYKEACCLLGMKERPTAILAANDQMATGVLRAASELRVRVPEELSVMGFDDIDAASWSIPALTTVRQPSYEVGAYSVKFLQQLIQNQGKTGKVNNKSFETKLIVRESVLDRI